MTDTSNTIEKLARALCKREGHANADLPVVGGRPYAVANRGLYITPSAEVGPLWQLWAGLAADLVDSVGEAAAEQYAEAVETGDAKAIAATKLARVIKEAFAS